MAKVKLYANGWIVKAINRRYGNYMGVEGDIWCFDRLESYIDSKELNYLTNYYKRNIANSWLDESVADVCYDIEYIKRYIKACQQAKLQVEVIFCKSTCERPICDEKIVENDPNYLFIGYDYAFSGESFYSCVYSDIYSKRIGELCKFSLNKYGLFQTEQELLNFIELREYLKSKFAPMTFEEGPFAIFQLWKYTGDFPIIKG